ncbi:MAG: hypothetical protein NZM43_13855, partial [Saprospiraceae bacterium]|nr:hypothetical protein [Saprospiraceae bacterium]MDW8485400.1 hypothetical protein [Saprospiraceae bacterium]
MRNVARQGRRHFAVLLAQRLHRPALSAVVEHDGNAQGEKRPLLADVLLLDAAQLVAQLHVDVPAWVAALVLDEQANPRCATLPHLAGVHHVGEEFLQCFADETFGGQL